MRKATMITCFLFLHERVWHQLSKSKVTCLVFSYGLQFASAGLVFTLGAETWDWCDQQGLGEDKSANESRRQTIAKQRQTFRTRTTATELLEQKCKALWTHVSKFINDVHTALGIEATRDKILHIFLGGLESLQLQLHKGKSPIKHSVPEEEAETEFSRAFEYNDHTVTYVSKLEYRLKRCRQVPLGPVMIASHTNSSDPCHRIRLRTGIKHHKLRIIDFG